MDWRLRKTAVVEYIRMLAYWPLYRPIDPCRMWKYRLSAFCSPCSVSAFLRAVSFQARHWLLFIYARIIQRSACIDILLVQFVVPLFLWCSDATGIALSSALESVLYLFLAVTTAPGSLHSTIAASFGAHARVPRSPPIGCFFQRLRARAPPSRDYPQPQLQISAEALRPTLTSRIWRMPSCKPSKRSMKIAPERLQCPSWGNTWRRRITRKLSSRWVICTINPYRCLSNLMKTRSKFMTESNGTWRYF